MPTAPAWMCIHAGPEAFIEGISACRQTNTTIGDTGAKAKGVLLIPNHAARRQAT